MDRFANLEKNAVKRPKSATATWKHSGSTTTTFAESSDAGNSLNLEQLRKEGEFMGSTKITDHLNKINNYFSLISS